MKKFDIVRKVAAGSQYILNISRFCTVYLNKPFVSFQTFLDGLKVPECYV